MATAEALIGLGMPAELALRLGYQQISATTTAATQGSAGGLLAGPGNKIVLANLANSGHAITLPAAAEIGDEIIVSNITANTGIIFPQSGGTINGNAPDATVALAANGTATSKWRLVKVTSTAWAAWEDGDV